LKTWRVWEQELELELELEITDGRIGGEGAWWTGMPTEDLVYFTACLFIAFE
jgi:hypothetical protein